MTGITALARIATANGITLVHVSSDYVFDGTKNAPYTEDDPLSPLGVYGQTKAAGDQITATVPKHYIIRTSWVIGDGNNFVRTMATLAQRGINPKVVNDQVGRLTFTTDIAAGIHHLLTTASPYGTYNLTSNGEPQTWADIAKQVFTLTGHDPNRITSVTTNEYYAGATTPIAPRPTNSVLNIERLKTAGYACADADSALKAYLEGVRR